ncbi:50S ribosomal protein L17 [Candidatus Hydrogenosomobacter endosymbioticus]|uniref:Large ribosomal subunit protein bL17 n=1 Tax=Candidatus Hydrogenosomobacter endosymbioticus TaxID=2558174 RepID=A0ABN6L7S5_9PROT|nr:50S ribosomal protein L17 [Candidatus Hydrogenosomobacter endosymbioticus]BDB96227.1 50S ribosomal protein L17 [Candidatus Hydrogenosomobacter endosymbioticus]
MRHGVAGKKFGRNVGQRKALFSGLVNSLIISERIITTVEKAKAIRPIVEKLVTIGRSGTLHSRRQIWSFLRNWDAQKKLVDKICPMYLGRPGGYTRIVKGGFRYGDNARVAVIEFVGSSSDVDAGSGIGQSGKKIVS